LSSPIAFYSENITDINKGRSFPDTENLASEDKQNKQGQQMCCDVFFGFESL
jgi:hypothetical protein